jgi:hypothetical protein
MDIVAHEVKQTIDVESLGADGLGGDVSGGLA